VSGPWSESATAISACGKLFVVVDEATFLDGLGPAMAEQALEYTEAHAGLLKAVSGGGILVASDPAEAALQAAALVRGADMLRRFLGRGGAE
jgi:hypothetical protein